MDEKPISRGLFVEACIKHDSQQSEDVIETAVHRVLSEHLPSSSSPDSFDANAFISDCSRDKFLSQNLSRVTCDGAPSVSVVCFYCWHTILIVQ